MALLIVLVLVLLGAGAIATVMVCTKGDHDYHQATKGNVVRLSWIYIIAISFSLAAVGAYIALSTP